ncbi:molybdate transport repressor ModE-like protein [Sinimarinibacterium flocculans]|uniref:Molybdate transport repressor ModE-like protein n=2 Tax=Sinimarinibacterium flocculans TaxID=985250 RepID=A0A318E9N2_9GAMM|nr:molybdate transport repressor ModE-like protein [Sinimarinibacterium flocculans]
MAGEESLGGRGRIELLERIAETGSIRQAAICMGMSYRSAWGAVELMNRRVGVTLVTRLTGGRGGGGAILSADGLALVKAYRRLEAEHARQVARLNTRVQALLQGE